MANAPISEAPRTGFFGHPRGLATLFFTEFWERFSYYGMRALLTLFMTASVAQGGLGFATERAGAIYGLYTAFVYLIALPGGWIADRILGQRRAVFIGGCIIAAGHFSMAIENVSTFFLGLVLIVIGTGLLKPNISAMVGDLYPEGGARRDAGFSIFYMGINLGAFVAPLVCGALGEKVNWHIGFAAAGVGMVLGLVQYSFGGKYLGEAGLRPNAGDDPVERSKALRVLAISGALGIALIALVWTGVINLPVEQLAGGTGVVIVSILLLYFLFQLTGGGLDALEKKKMLAIFVLFIFSALFWSGFEQAGSSLTLFARDLTDRGILGWDMPVSVLQSVNPLVHHLLRAGLRLALAQARRSQERALGARQVLPRPDLPRPGLRRHGLGGHAGGRFGRPGQPPVAGRHVPLPHLAASSACRPWDLSTVTKLAPHRKVSQMMGIWFMSIALGNLIAGLVAGQFEKFPLPQLFGAVFATTAGAGLILVLFIKPIRKLMGGVH